MAFDWSELLAVAEHLSSSSIDTCTPEALKRSAISRAYYAAFGRTKAYAVQQLGFRPREYSEDHERLRARLINNGFPRVAGHLQYLRSLRNEADYDAVVPELDDRVADALRLAQEVVDALGPTSDT